MTIYILHNSERQGPYTIDQLVGLIRKGDCLMSDMVWREGTAGWQPIYSLKDIGNAALPAEPKQMQFPSNKVPLCPPVAENRTATNANSMASAALLKDQPIQFYCSKCECDRSTFLEITEQGGVCPACQSQLMASDPQKTSRCLNHSTPASGQIRTEPGLTEPPKNPDLTAPALETAGMSKANSWKCSECAKTLSLRDKISYRTYVLFRLPISDLFKKNIGPLCFECIMKKNRHSEAAQIAAQEGGLNPPTTPGPVVYICPYCGLKYPEGTQVCAIDKTTLIIEPLITAANPQDKFSFAGAFYIICLILGCFLLFSGDSPINRLLMRLLHIAISMKSHKIE